MTKTKFCLRRRISCSLCQCFSFKNPFCVVKAEDARGRLSDRSPGFNQATIQLKVIEPKVGSRIEEPGELARGWRDRSDIGTLCAVTECARQTQILCFSEAAMFFRDDMVDLTTKVSIALMDQTVFAQRICSRFDQSAQVRADVTCHWAMKERARALARRIMCSSFR